MRRARSSVFDTVFVFGYSLLVVVLLVYFGASILTKRECLKLGYASSSVDWLLGLYCVTRVDQTDMVVPLEKARQHPR